MHLARKGGDGVAVAVVLAFKGAKSCEDDNWEHHVICCFIKASLWALGVGKDGKTDSFF